LNGRPLGPMSPPGTFVLSLDTELAWGKHDLRSYSHLSDWHARRENVRRMLEAFDRFSMPVTWALVGHLFLDGCDGRHEHPSYPQGWFDQDPGTDLARDPLWYGADIVEQIRAAAVSHDIGLHSFSHVVFSEVSAECAAVDAQRAVDVARAGGVEPLSFVFPRDRVGHIEALREAGVAIFRRPTTEWYRELPVPAKLKKLMRECFFAAPARAAVLRREGDGFHSVTTSMNLCGWGRMRGAAKSLYCRAKLRKIRLSLRVAARDGRIVHLAAHPHNFADAEDIAYLERVLQLVDAHVQRGTIVVKTMAELVQEPTETHP